MTAVRKICYVSGTRADFGLMKSTLKEIDSSSGLELFIAVTGMHLSPIYGETKNEIREAGFNHVIVDSSEESGCRSAMSIAIADQIVGLSDVFQKQSPDVVLVLGDRGEMLAAAIAALHLNIPVVHIHGGELSGTVDEPVRHAISKLSHFHFVSSENSKERLTRMGEAPNNIYVTGAPGLDDILAAKLLATDQFLSVMPSNFDSARRSVAVLYHPVVQKAETCGIEMQNILTALPSGVQKIIFMPNTDAGSQHIREQIDRYAKSDSDVVVISHLNRTAFLTLLDHIDLLVGNSSSGIIEAYSFGTRVVNIGNRQFGRARNNGIADVGLVAEDISKAIVDALSASKLEVSKNIYGDGCSGKRIARLLSNLVLEGATSKLNAY